ncbi:16S rRNA (cytidine(1402)-2'-O)-methyltransferase [candidate division KSB1 bacterium]|nr:16S rRNA (cytidine(1402)-2'-O)-methyltransferase [candidate division KSB1 bacterium]
MTITDHHGTLYLVSTPIGNLEDITLRAIRILKESDLIIAEDTRHSGILLKHYEIQNRLESYHDFNKEKKTPFLLQKLMKGQSIALVSDAGTPGISDPAFYLVRAASDAGIPISPIPGPTAAIAALVASGLATDRFVFEGFLPHKKGRKTRLEQLKNETRTIVLYESPHRILKALRELHEALGDRKAAVGRELTKKFEEIVRGTLSEVLKYFSTRNIKGEFVIIIDGQEKRKHG